jgi:sugar lactone lactonase YvrE
LWFSDTLGGTISSVGDDNDLAIEAEVRRPSGLGWLPDGRLVVATLAAHRDGQWDGPAQVLIGRPPTLEVLADLSGQGSFNDLVVGPDGMAFFDFYRGTAMQGEIMRMTADLQLTPAVTDLAVPNGLAITKDGARLLVSETGGDRITQFAIGPSGELRDRRLFAAGIPGPDGLCLDADDAVWVASFKTGRFLRICEGGACTCSVQVAPTRWAVAPMLGGTDRRTLYMISNDTDFQRLGMGISSGYLEKVRVEVEGAGWP